MNDKRGFTEDYLLYLKITKDLFKICLVGDGGVGKSTFIHFLSTGNLIQDDSIQRTPYLNIDGCVLGGHNLQLYDLAGQRRKDAHPLDHMQNVVLRGVDVLLFFFSLENLQSFINIKNWYDELKLFYKEWGNSQPIMYLIGNKLDLPRKVESFNGEELVERLEDFKEYYEISMVNGKNVEIFLKHLTDELDNRFKHISPEEFEKMKKQISK
ncbi:MAG: hypothetical protein FK733_10960 [Asgard group archaeon]|nr:hypothetical protein [Asgard group archaeon]